MATSETLVGFFRRFSEKSWVGGMHHYFNLTRVFNILETIRGEGGIVVEKDIGGKGYNWVIRFTNALANLLGDADLADSGDQATGAKRSSIQQRVVTVDSEEVTVYELHNFASPGTVAVAEGTDPATLLQKMVIRKETEAGDVTIEHATFNPLPTGDVTNDRLKWGTGAWEAVPKDADPTPPDIEIAVTDGGSATSPATVITGIDVDATNKHKLNVTTNSITFGDGGGLVAGDLTQVTYITAFQISGTYAQVKTRTGYVYSPGTESGWTTVHTFPGFST